MTTISFRKSWLLYLSPIAILIFSLNAFGFFVFDVSEIKSLAGFRGNPRLDLETALFLAPYTLTLLVGIWSVWRIALIRSAKLSIETASVRFVSGILPWAKEEQHWASYHIFNAKYRYSSNFFGWVFRIGFVVVVGKEGSTKEYWISGMHRPRTASMLINRLIADGR